MADKTKTQSDVHNFNIAQWMFTSIKCFTSFSMGIDSNNNYIFTYFNIKIIDESVLYLKNIYSEFQDFSLYHTVSYHIILHHTVLHCIIQYHTVA